MSKKTYSYFNYITSKVLEDQELTRTEVMLCAILYGMAKKKGYCWASNDVLSEIMNCSERTVTRSLKELYHRNHIVITKTKKGTRRIYPFEVYAAKKLEAEMKDKNVYPGRQKCLPPSPNLSTPVDKNVYPPDEISTISNDEIKSCKSKDSLINIRDNTRRIIEGESSPSPSAPLEEDELIEEVITPEHFSGKSYVHEEDKPISLYAPSSEEYAIANALWNFLNKSNSQYLESYLHKKEFTLQQWSDDFHKMIFLDKISVDEILFVLAWSQEEKYWSHKYFTAGGFRKRYAEIVKDMNSKGCYFEMSNSPDKEVTNQMISMWGEEILGQSSYHPRVHDLAKFVDATKKLLEFEIERGKERGRDKFEILVILFDCLKYYYKEKGDGILYVGHLCSDNTWGNLMPQFFTEHY